MSAGQILDCLNANYTPEVLANDPGIKLRDDAYLAKQLLKCTNGDLPVADRTITALHSGTHENLSGLLVCSDKLAMDSFESVAHGTDNVATPCNALQFIPNTQAKYVTLVITVRP